MCGLWVQPARRSRSRVRATGRDARPASRRDDDPHARARAGVRRRAFAKSAFSKDTDAACVGPAGRARAVPGRGRGPVRSRDGHRSPTSQVKRILITTALSIFNKHTHTRRTWPRIINARRRHRNKMDVRPETALFAAREVASCLDTIVRGIGALRGALKSALGLEPRAARLT